MSPVSLKTPLLALAGLAVTLAATLTVSSPALAADPVRGYYAEPPRHARVYRERVIRTTYVASRLDCQTLRIRERGVGKYYSTVCFKPLDLRP